MTGLNIANSPAEQDEILGQITPGKKRFLLATLLVSFLLPGLIFFVDGMNYYLHMLLTVFMYIAMASSWNMIGGYTGYTSLGHNIFLAIGAYFSGMVFLEMGISPFITAPIAGILAGGFGLLFGLISLRTRGPAFIISTIAMLLLLKLSFDRWDFIGGTNGISLPFLKLPSMYTKVPFYYGMLIAAIGAVYLSYKIRHSKFGLGLRAISQDEVKAEVAGIPTNRYKIMAFATSAIFVGMVGSLYGYYLTYLRPNIFLTVIVGAHMVLMSVLGGKGTVSGPVVGALLFIAINEFFVTSLGSSELNIAATGVILAVVLLFFPAGIIGSLKESGKLPGFLDWD